MYTLSMQERLQKILAAHGFGSRRKSEEFITAGRVTVNGKVAELGQKADPEVDRIEVDGKPVKESGEFLYYLLNKPVGVVCTNIGKDTLPKSGPLLQRITTSKGKGKSGGGMGDAQTVRDLLPPELRGRIVSVGRLDKDSEGLLLLTNDGALAHKLMHPRFEHEKEYEVTVEEPISGRALAQLKSGVMLDGTFTKSTQVERLSDRSFRITLSEGRNRQIRRMCEKIGFLVTKLKRVRIVTLKDTKMAVGSGRFLTAGELLALKSALTLGSDSDA